MEGSDSDDSLQRYLADRALTNLPYHQLVAISHQPWQDVADGHLDELAGAELARLEFDPYRLDTARRAWSQAQTRSR